MMITVANRHIAFLLLAFAICGLPASAQTTPPAAPPPPPVLPPESHQFDFWLGEWDVFNPKGKKVGESRIEAVADGWGILENWTGLPPVPGNSGKSLNTYDASRKEWRQFWVGGGLLEISGRLVDGRMVLSGESDIGGPKSLNRITWTPNPDGSVRQFWEQSSDDGKTWKPAFDGLYRHRAR
jgi:hypothetical protein